MSSTRSVIALKSATTAAHREQHLADRLLQLGQLRVVEPADEVEVHDRLAVRRLARAPDIGDPRPAVALDADDRVQQARRRRGRAPCSSPDTESTRNGQSSVFVSTTEPSGS